MGNGKLGGMLFGSPRDAHLQCNEDSLWHGGPRDRNSQASKLNLPKIRTLIFKGELIKAQELMQTSMTGTPEFQRHYVPAGDIILRNQQPGKLKQYHRELDLQRALVIETYEIDETAYQVELLASYPDNLMAYRVQASKQEGSKFRIHLTRSRGLYQELRCQADEKQGMLTILGQTGEQGVAYAQQVKVVTDGQLNLIGQYLTIESFQELIVYTTIATTYREHDPFDYCKEKLDSLTLDSWRQVKAKHLCDYQSLYQKISFDLGVSETAELPVLLQEAQSLKVSPSLIQLMFHFGRYLLISSSRPGTLPANLQGVWNKDLMPPWDSKYTININTEMNYWPAEACGLGECHLPLFDHLLKMLPNGQKTAKEMYGIEGFVAHHNTDLWGDTAPQDDFLPATYWPFGGAWLANHIMMHFFYHQNTVFLDKYFVVVEEAVRFLLGFLIELPNGELVTNPSVSPENSFFTEEGVMAFVSYGATMDNQLIWELFTNYLSGCRALRRGDLVEEVNQSLLKLPKHRIGKYGQLMEWYHDYEEAEPGHRHISHLYGVFPGHRLREETAEVKDAAKKTLMRRLENGGGHTGWSAAWLINLWAHFYDGEACLQTMNKQLSESVLPNLLDNHPPFQIDGNFGFTSGVIEALVFYYNERLDLLPALPKAWNQGKLLGVCLPNQTTISIQWEDSILKKVDITGDLPLSTKVFVKNEYLCTLDALHEYV